VTAAPHRGWVQAGSAVLAGIGLVYVPAGLLLGAVLGFGFQLDPTWPWVPSLVGNGFAVVAFLGGGALVTLLCAIGAAAALGRAWFAPWALGLAGTALLCTANLPGAALAFGLAYATTSSTTAAPSTTAPSA
jgi:hypothetical protein